MVRINANGGEELMTYVEEKVRQSLKCAVPRNGKVVPAASSRYLELAERIVREGVKWQDESGRIIDPYEKKETSTTTARYVGALGLLIMQGKCGDLIDSCAKALTPALEDLFDKRTNWSEFITKEACMAYMALKDKVHPDLAAQWKHLLGDYDPEQIYDRTFTNNPSDLYNFCTFAIAGEAIKKKLGLADNGDFLDRYVEQQLTLFDQNGMYNDPHSPITYDMVARMNLSLALWAGYGGKYSGQLSEMLRRGGLAQLLYQSPTGECPFGGRSNQQNFNEATFALICEFEAGRWAGKGDPALAGAFKRAASLAIHSIEKYLCVSPVYFTKNMFPPETQHGRQKGYGFYGGYSLLIASQLGFASLMANGNIEEQPCPAECGGYVFITENSFHKVFANCGGTHIEIDTNADFSYDATGLGRVHFANCPAELALSAPITAEPGYLTVIPPPAENISIGPGWNNIYLANLNGDKLQSACKVLKETPHCVKIEMDYTHDSGKVSEQYEISPEGIEISVTQHEGYPLDFRVPLLKTNGRDATEIKTLNNGFEVLLPERTYQVKCLTPDVKIGIGDFEAPNRNGIYKTGRFQANANDIKIHLSIKKK